MILISSLNLCWIFFCDECITSATAKCFVLILIISKNLKLDSYSESQHKFNPNSGNILNSLNGKISLRYRPPKTSFRINEQLYNLCVVWDILWCDYRNVSMEDCYLRQIIPDDNTFWKYYNDVLYKMSPQQKLNFMDSYYIIYYI